MCTATNPRWVHQHKQHPPAGQHHSLCSITIAALRTTLPLSAAAAQNQLPPESVPPPPPLPQALEQVLELQRSTARLTAAAEEAAETSAHQAEEIAGLKARLGELSAELDRERDARQLAAAEAESRWGVCALVHYNITCCNSVIGVYVDGVGASGASVHSAWSRQVCGYMGQARDPGEFHPPTPVVSRCTAAFAFTTECLLLLQPLFLPLLTSSLFCCPASTSTSSWSCPSSAYTSC